MYQISSELKLPSEDNICYATEHTCIYPRSWKTLSLGFAIRDDLAPNGIIIPLIPKTLANVTRTQNQSVLTIDVFNPNNYSIYIEYGDPICQILFKEEYKIWNNQN